MTQLGDITPDRAAILQPGDTLVFRLNGGPDQKTVKALKKRLQKRLPDVHVVVLAGLDDVMVIRAARKSVQPIRSGGDIRKTG